MIQNEVPLLHCHYRGSKNITSKRDLLVILSSALDDNAAPQNKELNNEKKKKTTEIFLVCPETIYDNKQWKGTEVQSGRLTEGDDDAQKSVSPGKQISCFTVNSGCFPK